jgi:hypothetical protein
METMSETNDTSRRLAAIMDALAEHAETEPDQQILEDSAVTGLDVSAEAGRVRSLLNDAVHAAKRERVVVALARQAGPDALLEVRANDAPTRVQRRAALLRRLLEQHPGLHEKMTTAPTGRVDSLSEDEVEQALREVAALGLLDEDAED